MQEWILMIFLAVVPISGQNSPGGRSVVIETVPGFTSFKACTEAWNQIAKDRNSQPNAIGYISFTCFKKT